MAKMENKGKSKSIDNQMNAFSCLSMISVLCTGSGYLASLVIERLRGFFYSIRCTQGVLKN